MIYRIRWWFTGAIARVYARYLFEDVETIGAVRHGGARLIVANHLSGFVDALVIMRLLGGIPHIIAKSTLFKPAPMGWIFRALGMVPIYRRSDHVDMGKNTSSFGEVVNVLEKGRTVLIFPEGAVTDTQELQTIRTGAARMALSAIHSGVVDLAIIPVGITYESKIASRPRVLVEVGEEIAATEMRNLAGGKEPDEADHALVDEVTDVVAERLRAVSPDFGSLVRERTMMLAASVHVRSAMTRTFTDPKMSDLRLVAQRLADEVDSEHMERLAATAQYQLALAASGLGDDQIQPRPRTTDLAKHAFRKGVAVLLIAPLALLGLVANLAAILLVLTAGAIVKKPMMKGTARAATGLIAFPVCWAILIAVVHPPLPGLALVLMVAGLVFLVVGFNQLVDLVEAMSDWWSVHNASALLPELGSLRGKAEGELSEILGSPSPPTPTGA